MESIRVLTWNMNFRTADALEPLAAMDTLPDVVTLQEIAREHADSYQNRLRELGFVGYLYSGDPAAGEMRYGNVIAAKWPLRSIVDPEVQTLDWPQLFAHAVVETTLGAIGIMTVHIPNGSGNGWRKVDALESVAVVVARSGRPLVLTGDFNEPRFAVQGGRIVTWGEELGPTGDWSPWESWSFDGVTDSGRRWDLAVRWFFEPSGSAPLRNALWEVAGPLSMVPTHFSHGAPRWFDHIFVSDDLAVGAVDHLYRWRDDGYSDHAPVMATLMRGSG